MEKESDTRGIPSWDGAEENFDIFEVECYQYRDTIEYGKRYLCGPRIARRLSGKAAVALLGRPQGWLNRNDGVEILLRFLRSRVFKSEIPDLGHHLDEFFFRLRRRRQESMTEYAMRSRDKYIKLQRALARVVKKAKKEAEPRPQSRVGTPPVAMERQSEEQEEDEVIDEEVNDSYQDVSSTQWRGSSNGGWRSWWHGGGWGNDGRSPSWSWSEASEPRSSDHSAKEDLGVLPDILPDVVLGWLLLHK